MWRDMRTYTSEELIRTQLKSVSVSLGEINQKTKEGARKFFLLQGHVSSGRNLLPKFMPISFFRCASRFWGVKIQVRPCLVPQWPQNMQIYISFRSRSGCWPCLGFSYPISFYRHVSRFVAFQTRAVHLCSCLVRRKMQLLMCLFFVPLNCLQGLASRWFFSKS